MKTSAAIYGLIKEGIYRIGFFYFNNRKRIAYQKVEIISRKYEIIKPEELIKYVKYFAKTESKWGFNWNNETNKFKQTPNLVFLDLMDRIQNDYERLLYLEWLINELPNYPAPGTGNVNNLPYYRDFKSLAINRLISCKEGKNEVKVLDPKITKAMINKAIEMACQKSRKENCPVVLKQYAMIKKKYPNVDDKSILEGYREFASLEDLVPQSTFYTWVERYKNNLETLKEFSSN